MNSNTEKIYCFKKFPQLSSLNVGYISFLSLLVCTLLAIIFIFKLYHPKLFLIIFLSTVILTREGLIRNVIMKKTEEVIMESNALIQKNMEFKNYLIAKDSNSNGLDVYKKSDTFYWTIGFVAVFLLFGISLLLHLNLITQWYIMGFVYCIWLPLFAYKQLNDIFSYYHNLIEIYTNKTATDKEKIYHASGQFSLLSSTNWVKIRYLSIVIGFSVAGAFLLSGGFQSLHILFSLSMGLIVFLGINIIWIDRHVGIFLQLLGKYDEKIKKELGIIFK